MKNLILYIRVAFHLFPFRLHLFGRKMKQVRHDHNAEVRRMVNELVQSGRVKIVRDDDGVDRYRDVG